MESSVKILEKDLIGGKVYQVIDSKYEDMPRIEGVMCKNIIDAVNEWLRPNNTPEKVKKFFCDVLIYHKHDGKKYHKKTSKHRGVYER